MPKYYLVVDGGATKTIVSLRDRDNCSLAEVEGTGSNFQVIGLPLFSKVIKKLVQDILSSYHVKKVDVILFALAGIDSQEDQAIVNEALKEIFSEVQLAYKSLLVENDAFSTLWGLTQAAPGVLVISGTGSIAYAHDGKGTVTRAGGWGHRSGDEGSGYWIGKEILQSIYRMEDGRNPYTLLQELVFDYLNITTIEELSKWLYGSNYSVDQVANLSHLLPLAIEKMDPVASEIFERTSFELVALAEAVIRSSNIQSLSCCIYFNGGTIRNFEELFLDVKRKVEKKFPSKWVELCTTPPIESIFMRAKEFTHE
jgi:N-acetylglucosamine kinase-like BadF-type ATPase